MPGPVNVGKPPPAAGVAAPMTTPDDTTVRDDPADSRSGTASGDRRPGSAGHMRAEVGTGERA